MKIGENIKQYRQKAGLSLRALAEKCGVDYSTLSRYESGKTTPRYDVLKKIARAARAGRYRVPGAVCCRISTLWYNNSVLTIT